MNYREWADMQGFSKDSPEDMYAERAWNMAKRHADDRHGVEVASLAWKNSVIPHSDLLDALSAICLKIEQCKPSPEMTAAVTFAADVRGAVSGDKYALIRVRKAMPL